MSEEPRLSRKQLREMGKLEFRDADAPPLTETAELRLHRPSRRELREAERTNAEAEAQILASAVSESVPNLSEDRVEDAAEHTSVEYETDLRKDDSAEFGSFFESFDPEEQGSGVETIADEADFDAIIEDREDPVAPVPLALERKSVFDRFDDDDTDIDAYVEPLTPPEGNAVESDDDSNAIANAAESGDDVNLDAVADEVGDASEDNPTDSAQDKAEAGGVSDDHIHEASDQKDEESPLEQESMVDEVREDVVIEETLVDDQGAEDSGRSSSIAAEHDHDDAGDEVQAADSVALTPSEGEDKLGCNADEIPSSVFAKSDNSEVTVDAGDSSPRFGWLVLLILIVIGALIGYLLGTWISNTWLVSPASFDPALSSVLNI